MNRAFILIAFLTATFGLTAQAKNLVIDRIIIRKHPIPAPYHVFISAKAGKAEATFNTPQKSYGGSGGVNASEIEIPLKLILKDVQLNTTATVSLQLDANAENAASCKAAAKHTARILMIEGPREETYIPALLNTPFVYTLFWHFE
jgi:hypothetical protein